MSMSPKLLRPRQTGFDPRSLSGLYAWYDANDAATLFEAHTGSTLSSYNGTVGRWEDKSGNGRHALQDTVANRPTRRQATLNGRDSVRFDLASSQCLSTAVSSPFAAPVAFTLFIATRSERFFQPGSARVVEICGANVSGDGIALGHSSTVSERAQVTYAGVGQNTDVVYATGVNYLWTYAGDGASPTRTQTLTRNAGSVLHTLTSSGTPNASSFIHLCNSRSSFLRADATLYEVLMYSRLLTATEQLAVQTYVNQKWKIF